MADVLKLNNNKITITDDVIDGRVLVSKTANLGGLLSALVKADIANSTSYLSNANLMWTNLSGAYLAGADLTGANLGDATLMGAILTGATLENANLTGANLTSATMPDNADTKAEFKAVVGAGNWDAVTTIWVDGNPIGK